MQTRIAAGTKLGPYEVVSLVGAGGMGEVYRAKDTRLGRDVAVKVLPHSFAADPERLRRFEQEARAAGMLNHPNILAVYDFGQHGEAPFVVTELLEGETLKERLGGTPMPVRKAIDYASQLARGLAAAHEKGIVHRDLKPENLFITREGRVKILDFGLAKTVAQAPMAVAETVATAPVPQTEAGMVFGTVTYMSPEQVRGQRVDHRSDIFSFGLVLYEMLTGKQAFRAESTIETMSAILKADPPRMSELAPGLPAELERIVLHCLEKSPQERFGSASDIAFHLESIGGTSTGVTAKTAAVPAAGKWKRVAVAGLLLAGGAALFAAGRITVPPPASPQFEPVTFRRGSVAAARYAPDGRTVVYSASWEGGPNSLYTAQPGNPESRPLDVQARLHAVSRTGELAVLLQRPGKPDMLARMPMNGGATRDVLEDVTAASWGPSGEQLAVVRAIEGRYRLEYPIGQVLFEGAARLSAPVVSSDGQRIAVGVHPVGIDNRGDVAVVDLSGKLTTLSPNWEDIGELAWSPDGKEVWFSGSNRGTDHAVYAVNLAGATRTLSSGPGSLSLQDVTPDGRVLISHGFRRPGIVVRPPNSANEVELGWMDYSWFVDLSDDGKYILFSEQGTAGGPGYAVYLRPTDGSPAVRLGKGDAHSISHDGKWVAAVDLETQTLQLLPTGAGQPRKLPSHELVSYFFVGFFPDGQRLIIAATDKSGSTRMYVQEIESGAQRAITPPGVFLTRNTVSPDGKWLAAATRGKLTAYPVDGGEPRELVRNLPETDRAMRWNHDGTRVYVRSGLLPAQIASVDVKTGARTVLYDLTVRDNVGVNGIQEFRMTPDGKSYGFGYVRTQQNLYQVTGLK
jgi:Tol biopolymer transport system component